MGARKGFIEILRSAPTLGAEAMSEVFDKKTTKEPQSASAIKMNDAVPDKPNGRLGNGIMFFIIGLIT